MLFVNTVVFKVNFHGDFNSAHPIGDTGKSLDCFNKTVFSFSWFLSHSACLFLSELMLWNLSVLVFFNLCSNFNETVLILHLILQDFAVF